MSPRGGPKVGRSAHRQAVLISSHPEEKPKPRAEKAEWLRLLLLPLSLATSVDSLPTATTARVSPNVNQSAESEVTLDVDSCLDL